MKSLRWELRLLLGFHVAAWLSRVVRCSSGDRCCFSVRPLLCSPSSAVAAAVLGPLLLVPRGLLVGSAAAVLGWVQRFAWFSGWISCGCLLLVSCDSLVGPAAAILEGHISLH
ncbi:hypothetical protein QYF36_008532 [Acer negundo]|nr:hypothetical protein QYF36_008532 [Acer negundo]